MDRSINITNMSPINEKAVATRKQSKNDINYRKALVDTFIWRIKLFDDHMMIYYNAGDGHSQNRNVPLEEPSAVLPRGTLVEARGVEPLSEKCPIRFSTGVDHFFTPRKPERVPLYSGK